MATYTITTNNVQEDALTWVVSLANAEIDKQNIDRAKRVPPLAPLPLYTNETYLKERIKEILKGWKRKYQETMEIAPIVAVWESLTNTQINQIKTIAGV